MEYKKVANTSLQISALTLGTWVFGGDMWGGAKDKDSEDTVRAALDGGINTIDTAPVYGFGRAESIVGKAIKHCRGKVILVTKCGLKRGNGKIQRDLTPAFLQTEIDNSLKRLQTDYIDIYLCHWPDPTTPLEKTLEFLLQLQEKGKIRYIGFSNYEKADLIKACEIAPITIFQGQYSLLSRELEGEIIPFCQEKNIGIMAYGSLGGGILSGKYLQPKDFTKGDARSFFYRYYKGENFEKAQSLIRKMRKLKRPLNEVAINWVRQQKGVTTVVVGCRNPQQVMANLKTVQWHLTEEEIKILSGD